jgi:PAS domain S-box-containing protein
MRSLTPVVPAVALLALVWDCPSASAQPRSVRTALAVHWSSEDYPSNPVVDAAIRQVLQSRDEAPVDYFAEYLESDRFPDEHATLAFRDYLQRKYQGRRIDVVLAITDPALQFVLKYRDQLFPGVPIVASASSTLGAHLAADGVTGVTGRAADAETIELALSLHPSTQRVFVVVQKLTDGYLEGVQAALAKSAERVELRFIQEGSVPGLPAVVRAVPANSLIHFIRFSREDPGNVMFPLEVVRMVAEASPVPVYASTDSFVGTGVVGGMVRLAPRIGSRIGEIALQVLDGRRPQDIPFEQMPAAPVFDWRQVQRWGIDRSLLPPGSEIRYREPTAWELYRWYIVGALALVAVQGVTIAALVVQRSRRREVEARNSAMLHAMPDAMLLLTRDGMFVDYHTSDKSRIEAKPDEFCGRHLREVFPREVAAAFEERFVRLVSGQVPARLEYALQTSDGERQYEARIAACGDHHLLAVVRDITERKHAERQLYTLQNQLAQASRLTALGEFAASIAHEVRQPLTAIIAGARAALRFLSSGSTTEARESLSNVLDAGKRADEVIERNRELFRSHTVRKEPLDINRVVLDAAAMAGLRIESGRVALTTSLAEGLPTIGGDPIQLHQVLLNLIVNAIDAMDTTDAASRRLEITTALASPGTVQVSVRDNGVGLDPVDTQQMFTLSYTTKEAGTGVGLSISRSIVEAHGGRLWAEQNPTRGATFSFTVPALGALPPALEPVAS